MRKFGSSVQFFFMISGLTLNVHSQELITDPHFQQGVKVRGTVPSATTLDMLQHTTENGAPYWGLAEWWSQESLSNRLPVVRSSGALQWSNAYKSVTLGPTNGADSDLILYVDSVADYNGNFRSPSDRWPHLLVEQGIGRGSGRGRDLPWLSELDELYIHIEARLNSVYNEYGSGYNPSHHAAQFILYLTVQNLKVASPGYGKRYYFGLKLYDDRHAKPGPYMKWDQGTKSYIYNIGLPFSETGMAVGEWKTIAGDMLPHIKIGLNKVREAGGLPASGDLADYKIGGMNMGWEIPGLSRAEMQIRNFSLMYAPKDERIWDRKRE